MAALGLASGHPVPRPTGVPRWRAVRRGGARRVPGLRTATCGTGATTKPDPGADTVGQLPGVSSGSSGPGRSPSAACSSAARVVRPAPAVPPAEGPLPLAFQPGGGPEYQRACRDDTSPAPRGEPGAYGRLCSYREHALISRQEHEAWDVLLACQGQLRLAPSGHVIGIDWMRRSRSQPLVAATLPYSRSWCQRPRSVWSRRCRAIEFEITGLDQDGRECEPRVLERNHRSYHALMADRPSSSSAAGGTPSRRAEAPRSARPRPGSYARWCPGRAWTCRRPA